MYGRVGAVLLSATTATKVVTELIADGSLAEVVGAETTGGTRWLGRPGIDVALVPQSYAVLGVQAGVGFVQLAVCDLLARPQRSIEFSFDPAGTPAERVVDSIAEQAAGLIGDRSRLLGVGVAAEHNVRAMAVAEDHYGAARDVATALYVYLRTGLGAGFVMGGLPFHPGRYGVTELGHLRVVEKGRTCACGATGCLETVVSESYLYEQVVAAGGDPAALMAAVELLPAVRDDLVEHLTTGLASAVNLLNPELILLGGRLVEATDATLAAIAAALRGKAFPVLRAAVRVEKPTLGLDAGVIGGAAIALDRIYYAPEHAPEGATHP